MPSIASAATPNTPFAAQPTIFHLKGVVRSSMTLKLDLASITPVMIGTELTALMTAAYDNPSSG